MLWIIKKLIGKKSFTLSSSGNSMLPLLRTGDLVYYKKCSFQSIRINDILLINKRRKLFTHRVIYKTDSYIITKGDNNSTSDGKIYSHQIVAKARYFRRGDKKMRLEGLYTAQSLLYFHEITTIIKAFQKKAVDVLILKGLPLHLFYEGRRPNRLYSDCDILIAYKDKEKATSVLTGYGYIKGDTALSALHKRLRDKETEDSFYKLVGSFPVVLDIHYEVIFMMTQLGKLDPLYPQSLIDEMTASFLKDKRDVYIDAKEYPILSESNLILYLMLHFFHHNFTGTHRLSLIHNILSKIRDKTALFNDVAAGIHRYHLKAYIYPTLLLLIKYYKTPIPPAFMEAVIPPESQYSYINRHVLAPSIFDERLRVQNGIVRFKNLFFLSPLPIWKKSLVFMNPAVIYSMAWTVAGRLGRIINIAMWKKRILPAPRKTPRKAENTRKGKPA